MLRAEAPTFEQFAFQTCKEALGHRVVVRVADRSRRADDSCLSASLPLLTPGSTFYLKWAGEWVRLDNWGFRLVESGTYSITGIPLIASNMMGTETTTVKSHTLVIKILPK